MVNFTAAVVIERNASGFCSGQLRELADAMQTTIPASFVFGCGLRSLQECRVASNLLSWQKRRQLEGLRLTFITIMALTPQVREQT